MCPTRTGVLKCGTLSGGFSFEINRAKTGWRSQQDCA
jgi:hypothetical protein